MGLGDEVIASGYARVLHEETGAPIAIVNREGQPRDHILWRGIPFLTRELVKGAQTVSDGPHCRSYVERLEGRRFVFRRNLWPPRGLLVLSEAERRPDTRICGPFLVLEPNVKRMVSSDNKDWGRGKWLDLNEAIRGAFPDLQVVQPAPKRGRHRVPDPHGLTLPGAVTVDAEVRRALGIFSHARAFVTTDGLLHHAAAALGIPAVVIWGGYSSPDVVGYRSQTNVWHGGDPCGNLTSCAHCRKAMNAITVEEVFEKLKEVLS